MKYQTQMASKFFKAAMAVKAPTKEQRSVIKRIASNLDDGVGIVKDVRKVLA